MEAFPHIQTIDYFVENEADRFPQSRVLDFHNKADGHERRLATYLVENVRTATDLEVRQSTSNLCCLLTAQLLLLSNANRCRHTPTSRRSSRPRR